jgi:general secretion pathway protein D
MVSMDINQEVSKAAGGATVAGKEYPAFRKRSVTTTLTVGDKQMIVIGGLIDESVDHTDSGIPFLNKIPFLKYLAGSKSRVNGRNELIISITPYVITSLEDVDAVSMEFKTKIGHNAKVNQ